MTPTLQAFIFCLFIGGPAFGFWAAFRSFGSQNGMTMAFLFGAFNAYCGWLVSGLVAKTLFPWYPLFGGPSEPVALLFVLPGFVTGYLGIHVLGRIQQAHGYTASAPEEIAGRKRRFVNSFIIIVIVLVLVLGLMAALTALFLSLFGRVGTSVLKTDRPRTVQEAYKLCPIPLPDGAFNVQCADWGAWLAVVRIVKFQAPVEVCKVHAIRLVEEHNRSNPGRVPLSITLQALRTPRAPVSLPPEMEVDWFDVNNILSGFIAGESGSHTPQVWIDDQRGVFYYLLTD